MNIFDPSKSFVENLNYLSGPILAILGFAAIIQLRLTKKAIVTTSKRQAAELAAKQIEIYTSQIYSLQNKLYDHEQSVGIKRFVMQDLKQFTYEEMKERTSNEIFDLHFKHNQTIVDEILEILNAMDTFAIYFTKGVADEEIAYSAVGRSFCFSIERYSFNICLAHNEEDATMFGNAVELYQIWNARIKSEKLSKDLENKHRELENIKIKKVDIIGTK